MDEKIHTALTGAEAHIETHEGGWFKVYGANNIGYSVKLIPNERIVLAWSHRDFPEGHYPKRNTH